MPGPHSGLAAAARHGLIALTLASTIAAPARAQGDGPRAFQLLPRGTNVASLYGLFTRGNTLPDASLVVRGASLDVDLAVGFYGHPLAIGGRAGAVYALLPVGEVSGRVDVAGGRPGVDGSSSGFADLQIGVIQGLVGSPALTRAEYVSHKPGLAVGALAVVTAPIGAYDSARVLNLGANRWGLRLGVPITWYVGRTLLDPHLTTFEFIPNVLLFTDNDAPFRADARSQAALFRLEGHVTRNLSRAVWVSLDGLWVLGGETTTDAVADDNAQDAFSLGGTLGVALSRSFMLKATYGGVVARNDGGPDGEMVRIVGSYLF